MLAVAVPTFVSAGALFEQSGTGTANIPAPAGVAANDVVLVHLYKENNAAVTPPAGFTQVGVAAVTTGNTQWHYLFWKRSAGSEPSTYSFTWTGTTYAAGQSGAYRGCVAAGSPIDVSNSNTRSTTTTNTTPNVSVTTTGPDRLLVWAGTNWNESSWTAPTNFTLQGTTSSTTVAFATRNFPNAGASGNVSGTASLNNSSTAWLVALLPAGVTYFVDNSGGSDANNGVTTATAWASISKVNSTTLRAGDQVLFRRGRTFTSANLTVNGSGTSAARITIGAYDAGAAPIFNGGGTNYPIRVNGNWVTVQDVTVRQGGQADKVGLAVFGTDCLVQRVTATANGIGVQAYAGAHRLRVTASSLINNTTVIVGPGTDDDYGASGIVLLAADGCEVDNNTISGNRGTSPDYGFDGSAIEVFGATNAEIHHNSCVDNQTFTELGDPNTANIVYHNNLVTSVHADSIGLNAQGTGAFGPVGNIEFVNNTIVLTGGGNGIVVDTDVEAYVHNNIVQADYLGFTAQPIDEGHNVYFGGAFGNDILSTAHPTQSGIAPTSTVANPQFVSTSDFHLQAGSPATDRGVAVAYATDLDGLPRTSGAAPDAGAYERQVSAAVVGTGSAPLGGLSGVAAGTRVVVGTGSGTLGGLAAAATGTHMVDASAVSTLGGLSGVAAGIRVVDATGSAGLGGLQAIASGIRAVDGDGQAPLGGLVASAQGLRVVDGTASTDLGGLTGVAQGTRLVDGAATADLGALSAVAYGDVVTPVVPGAGAADLGSLTATAAGTPLLDGTALAQLGALIATALASGPPRPRAGIPDVRASVAAGQPRPVPVGAVGRPVVLAQATPGRPSKGVGGMAGAVGEFAEAQAGRPGSA